MRKNIHHKTFYYAIKCLSCGNEKIKILTTLANVNVESCSKCHVYYTKGSYTDKKIGRVDRFYRKYKER